MNIRSQTAYQMSDQGHSSMRKSLPNDRPPIRPRFQEHGGFEGFRDQVRQSGIHDLKDDLSTTMTPKIAIRNLNFFYGTQQVLFSNTLDIADGKVTAIIGPSGCGKSTHVRVYNRIFELYKGQHATGEVLLDDVNILSSSLSPRELRCQIGMIFQTPTPFPFSIFENIAYGLRLHYTLPALELSDRVESALKKSALLDEIQDHLHQPGTALSSGQQQRLCIARALALEPEVLVMDDPTSALDPVATRRIEELIESLKHDITIVIVTHDMQQAARLSDFTAFFHKGYLVEYGRTNQIFTNPVKKQTEEYITGRFVL